MERMLLILKRSPEQESALRKLLDEQLDQTSPNFHKWLTPDEFGQQFGPSSEDIRSVTSWLESHGFQVAGVSKGRTVIEFSGSVRQVQEAFHISIHKYLANGEEHWANAADPQIPTALAPAVAGIDSLHDFQKKPLVRAWLLEIAGHGTNEVSHAVVHRPEPLFYRWVSDQQCVLWSRSIRLRHHL
jgi:subtilase family serine protease